MQLRITARMYIGAPSGRLGLRGAAARRSATWPFALVGLRATSHTCDSLYAMPLAREDESRMTMSPGPQILYDQPRRLQKSWRKCRPSNPVAAIWLQVLPVLGGHHHRWTRICSGSGHAQLTGFGCLFLHDRLTDKDESEVDVSVDEAMSFVRIRSSVTSHNSTYVHRRLGRRLGLRGAAARRSATSAPRPRSASGPRHIRAIRYGTLRH